MGRYSSCSGAVDGLTHGFFWDILIYVIEFKRFTLATTATANFMELLGLQQTAFV